MLLRASPCSSQTEQRIKSGADVYMMNLDLNGVVVKRDGSAFIFVNILFTLRKNMRRNKTKTEKDVQWGVQKRSDGIHLDYHSLSLLLFSCTS